MELREKVGQHITVRTADGSLTGILLDVSAGTGPQYIVLRTTPPGEEPRDEFIPWHEVKTIFPYSPADEEVISQLEHLEIKLGSA
jgi:hypothetical protein